MSEKEQSEPQTSRPAVARRSVLLGVASVALLAAVRISTRPESDVVPADEIDRRRAEIKAGLPLKVDFIRPDELDAAMQSLTLQPADHDALRQAVEAGRIRLFWLALFDSDAEDGDVVAVQSLGLSQTITLTKAPKRIALPMAPSGQVTLTGTNEGLGGGVTVGLVAQNRVYKFPPIAVGSSDVISVVGN